MTTPLTRAFSPTIGNDPEVFVVEEGKVLPAEELQKHFPTSKKTPTGAEITVDNATVEIKAGAFACLQQQNRSLTSGMGLLLKALRNRFGDKTLVSRYISLSPSLQVTKEDIGKYESLRRFGCEPSFVFNDGSIKVNRPEVDPETFLHRSAGFHIHLGSPTPDNLKKNRMDNLSVYMGEILHTTEGRLKLVQMCDLLVGIAGVMLERSNKVIIRRQEIGYGKAGEFREQPHGFEYRTLGPWPYIHPMWTWFVNSMARDALILVVNKQEGRALSNIDMNRVANTINNNDLPEAIRIWNELKKIYSDHITEAFNHNSIFLSLEAIKLFEFILSIGGIKATAPRFSFTNWGLSAKALDLRYVTGNGEGTYFWGFRNHANAVASRHNSFLTYGGKWELRKDNIGNYLIKD